MNLIQITSLRHDLNGTLFRKFTKQDSTLTNSVKKGGNFEKFRIITAEKSAQI